MAFEFEIAIRKLGRVWKKGLGIEAWTRACTVSWIFGVGASDKQHETRRSSHESDRVARSVRGAGQRLIRRLVATSTGKIGWNGSIEKSRCDELDVRLACGAPG